MSPGDSSTATVAVILLTLDQRERTLRCLSSLEGVTEPSLRIVLWDNGSVDGTAESARQRFPEVLVHHHHTNLGVASGRNAAVRLAIDAFDPPFLFFLDNDMEVSSDLITTLIEPFAQDDALGLTTGKIKMLDDNHRLYGAGGCSVRFWSGETGHVAHGEVDRGQYDKVRRCLPSGGCLMVRSEVFRELQGFDSIFDPYGPEDLDFGLRAQKAGYYGLYLPTAVAFHEPNPGHTFEGGMSSHAYVRNKTRLWLRFMRRHASLGQQLAFFLVGAPVGFFRVVVRESRRGNVRALRGLVHGFIDHLSPRSKT